MILLIDQGNSSMKWRLVESATLECVRHAKTHSGDLTTLLSSLTDVKQKLIHIYLSSVRSESLVTTLTDALNSYCNLELKLAITQQEFNGMHCGYRIASQMGVDRWLAMIAVREKTKSAFVVIDAGSAVTIDLVNPKGEHLGGQIVPGLSLQKKVLQQQTDRVIFNEDEPSTAFQVGLSTSEAVNNGCLSLICGYLTQMLNHHQIDTETRVYITGGDAQLISTHVDFEHQLTEDLVLEGLFLYFDG